MEENVYALALELLEEIKKQKTKETERRKAKKDLTGKDRVWV